LQYVFLDRTIQNRIKNLGFKWIPKERKYQFVGADESVYDRTTDDVFKSESTSKRESKTTVKKEIKKTINEVAVMAQDASNIDSENAIDNKFDNIDRLLAGKKVKRIYRGFYFDGDVLNIIDRKAYF
jgi:hypothetical protein